MCKLNIKCSKIEGECNCSVPKPITNSNTAQTNSLLTSILVNIQNQPEILKDLQSHSNPNPPQPSHLTHISSSPIINDFNLHEKPGHPHISLISGPKKAVVVGKPFSILACIEKYVKVLGVYQEKILLSVFLESRKDKNVKILLASVESNGSGLFKNLVVDKHIEYARIAIRADCDYIESFVQNIKIKENVDLKCGKKVKLLDE